MNSPNDVDFNSLVRLKEALEGAQKNTRKMLNRLERFERKLSDLDEKMRPVQVTTRRFTKAKDNISLTLTEVGKTYEFFRVATEVKELISLGYAKSDHREFLEAYLKLSSAKCFFETHKEIKSASSVLGNVESLLSTAESDLLQEFDRLLQSSNAAQSKAAEDNNHSQSSNNISDSNNSGIAQDIQRELKSLCDAFEVSHCKGHFKLFQTARINNMRRILKSLETEQAAAWNALQGDDPHQRGTLPFNDLFLLAYQILRSEYQLWAGILPTAEDTLPVFIAICDAALSELQRMLSPLLADTTIKAGKGGGTTVVIGQSKILLIRLDLLDIFGQRYEEFRDVCHPDARHESSASLTLRSMRQGVIQAALRALELLLSPTTITDGFFTVVKKSALSSATATATGSNASHSQSEEEATSCDLHPITGNILYLAKELAASYGTVLRHMLELASSFGIASASLPIVLAPSTTAGGSAQEADQAALLLVDHLLVALETRAERFDDHSKPHAIRRSLVINKGALYDFEDKSAEECVLAARKHLFLINNVFALLSFVRDRRKELLGGSAADQAVKRAANQSGKGFGPGQGQTRTQRLLALVDRLEVRLASEQELFCETVAIALGFGTQDMSEFQTTYEHDKSNQMRLLKGKFSMFNSGMEAFLAQQGEWRVSNSSLRESLAAQLTQRISLPYQHFFTTYSAIKFSKKHTNDYLRFTPAQLEQHLRSFFGRSS